MKRNLILTPGPTKIPQFLYDVLSQPIIHHRTPLFQESIKKVTEGLKYIFQTENDVYLLAASGTGGLEAAVCNLLSKGEKALVVDGGKFGERWTELCDAYDIKSQVLKVEWGSAIDPTLIKEALENDPEIKVVFTTLCETSTGVVTDIESIGKLIKDTEVALVVDCVSGLGVTDMQMDNWGVDVSISASHKGFMLPPGLGFMAVSAKAKKLFNESTNNRYYFDLRKSEKAFKSTDTPFTPTIQLVIAMEKSLEYFKEKGLKELLARYEYLAKGTRQAMRAIGLELLAKDDCIANVLTPVLVPEGIDGGKIVKTMRDVHGISIAGGQGHLKGKLFRIAHMGCVNEEDLITCFTYLEEVLDECGYKFEKGASIKAAQEYFNQSSVQ